MDVASLITPFTGSLVSWYTYSSVLFPCCINHENGLPINSEFEFQTVSPD